MNSLYDSLIDDVKVVKRRTMSDPLTNELATNMKSVACVSDDHKILVKSGTLLRNRRGPGKDKGRIGRRASRRSGEELEEKESLGKEPSRD